MLATLWLISLRLLFDLLVSAELNMLFLALSVSLTACFTSDAMQCCHCNALSVYIRLRW